MKHPDDEQLLTWLDGESGSPEGSDAVAAHVEQCARCQQWIEGVSSVGLAVRVWAEDAVPPPVADLADRVLRAAGARVEPRATGGPAAHVVVPVSASRGAWRRFGVPAAALLAAAAMAVFAVRRFAHGPDEHSVLAAIGTRGSEVLSVQSDSTVHNDVSVMEMRDEQHGSTIAVVWIADDQPKPSSDNRLDPEP